MAAAKSSSLFGPGSYLRVPASGALMQACGVVLLKPAWCLLTQVTQTLQWAVRSWTDLESSIMSVERMQDYAGTPKEVMGGRWGWKVCPTWDLQQRAVDPCGRLPRALEPPPLQAGVPARAAVMVKSIGSGARSNPGSFASSIGQAGHSSEEQGT